MRTSHRGDFFSSFDVCVCLTKNFSPLIVNLLIGGGGRHSIGITYSLQEVGVATMALRNDSVTDYFDRGCMYPST